MFERFSRQSRHVVQRAHEEARGLRHHQIGTEHLLLAMLDPGSGLAHEILTTAGLDQAGVRADVERLAGQGAQFLGREDAAALQAIGIDLDAVRAKIEETFGADALETLMRPPPRRRGLLRRRELPTPPGRLRFTPRSKKVLELSLREAIRLKHNYIGSEHILLGLLREGGGLAAKILADAGANCADLRSRTEAALHRAA